MRDVVLGFLAGEGIEVKGEGEIFLATFPGESDQLAGIVRVDENTGIVAVYSVCPVTVPPARMAQALELVARLNFGHVLGNLEVDVESGSVRFKTSLDVEGEELTEGLVANLVYANIASMEQMLPAIRAVAVDALDVRAALETMLT